MEKEVLQIKKEDCILPKGGRGYLVFPNKNLVPGSINEADDYFEIALDTEGLLPASDFFKGQGPDRYRFLIACAELEGLRKNYSFSLDPENLMYDASFTPKARIRDGASHGKDSFSEEYKALIASVLAPEYAFSDYIEGGSDLFDKNKLLESVAPLEDIAEIAGSLRAALFALQARLAKDSMLIGRGKYRIARIVMLALICLVCVLSVFSIKNYNVDLPRKEMSIEMFDRYIAHDYSGLLQVVSGIELASLSQEERYIAAYAGVVVANLSESQRNAVMKAVTLNTDSLYLDYWIEMGLGEYEPAIDISRRIGDTELELYALVIFRDAVSIDMSITGAEKAEQLRELDTQINALEKQIMDLLEAGQDE